eukprot:57016-Eustigmatos_ZCMA.PRE.1
MEYLENVLEPFVRTLDRWTVLLMGHAPTMNTYASVLAQPQTVHSAPMHEPGNPTGPTASMPPQAHTQTQAAPDATAAQPQVGHASPAPRRNPAPMPSREVRVAGLLHMLKRKQSDSKVALEALGFSRNMLEHANISHMTKADGRGRDVMILAFTSTKEAGEFMRGKGRKLQGLPSVSMNYHSKYAYTPEARLRQVQQRLEKLAPTTNTSEGESPAEPQVNPPPPQTTQTDATENMDIAHGDRAKRSAAQADLPDNDRDSVLRA